MSTDEILFIIRLLSAAFLIIFLIAIFAVMWRSYRTIALQSEARRRSYGRLVRLIDLEGMYTETGDAYPLQPLTSIGRSPTNAIVLDTSFASSEHATIYLRDGQWWLEDRNSRNGTLLNGDRITAPTIVTEGDVIGIGEASFKLIIE